MYAELNFWLSLATLVLFSFLVIRQSFQKEKEKPKSRGQLKAESTEQNYAGRIYSFLKAGARLNTVLLEGRWKLEVLKPAEVGGPDNGATRIEVVRTEVKTKDRRPLFYIDIDGKDVEVATFIGRLPVAELRNATDRELDRAGWMMGEFLRQYDLK